MARLQPHRCRWMKFKPSGKVRKKGEKRKDQKFMCWQRGARVRERECLPCLLAFGIAGHSSYHRACKPPQFKVK